MERMITFSATDKVVDTGTRMLHIQSKPGNFTDCGVWITSHWSYPPQEQPECHVCRNCLRIVAVREKKAFSSTRLAPHAIGDAAIRLFQTPEFSHLRIVSWGEWALLDAIAREAEMPQLHVLVRHKRILDALERDKRFEKFLFRCHHGSDRRGLARAFRLIEQEQQN